MQLKSNLIIEVSYRYEGTLLTIWREDEESDFWHFPHEHLIQWYTPSTQKRFMDMLKQGVPQIIGNRLRFRIYAAPRMSGEAKQVYRPNRIRARTDEECYANQPYVYGRRGVKRGNIKRITDLRAENAELRQLLAYHEEPPERG